MWGKKTWILQKAHFKNFDQTFCHLWNQNFPFQCLSQTSVTVEQRIHQTPRIALSVGPFVTEKYRIVHSQCVYDMYDAIVIIICVRCDHHDDDDNHHLCTMIIIICVRCDDHHDNDHHPLCKMRSSSRWRSSSFLYNAKYHHRPYMMHPCAMHSYAIHRCAIHPCAMRLCAMQRCVGHTAWAPEGRKGRSQGGPKGHRLEVGARRAPKLLFQLKNLFY